MTPAQRAKRTEAGPMVYVPSAEGVQTWGGLTPALTKIAAEAVQTLASEDKRVHEEANDGR